MSTSSCRPVSGDGPASAFAHVGDVADLRVLAAEPVLRALHGFGPPPAALHAMLTSAAVAQLDSDMVIGRGTAAATFAHGPSAPTAPTTPGSRPDTGVRGLADADLALAGQVVARVRNTGLARNFGDLMGAFGRLMNAVFFTPEQQARALACAQSGAGFSFLASDAGGPALAGWHTIAEPCPGQPGRIRLTVAKVWGIGAHQDGAAVVVARLPGVTVPAAYLVWPEVGRQLVRQTCGAPFLDGVLQLGNVSGRVDVHASDRLRAGGMLMLNKYLTLVRPFFIGAVMAHLDWLAGQGRLALDGGASRALAYIAAAAVRQGQHGRYQLEGERAVLALKFASNTLLGALVRKGRLRRFEDQRDLLAFTKMEGSSYRCYHELHRAAGGTGRREPTGGATPADRRSATPPPPTRAFP